MGRFNRDGDRGGFGGNRGGGSRFGGDRDRGPVVMHDAICAECQKNCQVPFRPSSDKPVYCSECFTKRGGPARSDSGSSPRRDFGNRNDSRPQMRPSFSGGSVGGGDTKKQLELINAKLDKLVSAIEAMSKPASSGVKEAVKEALVEKTKKVAKKAVKKIVKK